MNKRKNERTPNKKINMETNKKTNKRKSKKSIGSKIIFTIILLLLIPALLNGFFKQSTDTAVLRTGIIEETIPVNGVFIRSEVLVSAPFSGICIPDIEQGKMVSVGQNIATVTKETSVELTEKIKDMERSIIKKEILNSQDNNHEDSQIKAYNENLLDNINGIVEIVKTNNLLTSTEIIKNMNNTLFQKTKYIVEKNPDELISKIEREELSRLKNKLLNDQKPIKANISGIVSYYIDGYEEILKPDKLNEINDDIIFGMNKQKEIDHNSFENIKAEAGQPFVKVIDEHDYYFAFTIDKKVVSNLREGEQIEIFFKEIEKIIIGEVVSLPDYYADINRVIVKFNRNLNETLLLRACEAEITIKKYEGLMVPIRCIRNINYADMTADIVLAKLNQASYVKVKIVALDKTSAIIENFEDYHYEGGVSLYDIYIQNPDNIREGQMID